MNPCQKHPNYPSISLFPRQYRHITAEFVTKLRFLVDIPMTMCYDLVTFSQEVPYG